MVTAEYIDKLMNEIIAGAVVSGADVDIADWVYDLKLLANLAEEGL